MIFWQRRRGNTGVLGHTSKGKQRSQRNQHLDME